MQLKLCKNLFIIMVNLLFTTTFIYSQNVSKTGTTSASVLEIGIGATSTSMGGAFVSVVDDVSALYWNASGIANLTGYQAMVSHTSWIADTRHDFAGLVLPLGEFGTLGFSLSSLSMDI